MYIYHIYWSMVIYHAKGIPATNTAITHSPGRHIDIILSNKNFKMEESKGGRE